VIHKMEILLVDLALGQMNPERLRLKLFTRLAGDKKDAVQEALMVPSVERERSNQAWMRGGREMRASDVFGANFGQKILLEFRAG
jgi:hypothetical protein